MRAIILSLPFIVDLIGMILSQCSIGDCKRRMREKVNPLLLLPVLQQSPPLGLSYFQVTFQRQSLGRPLLKN
ncbi:hypothetical protein HOY80DRAFT_939656 [Tuber brumale]|nr:hypothetical protein HOY80DRAFT_939656 [Tuber brumale]